MAWGHGWSAGRFLSYSVRCAGCEPADMRAGERRGRQRPPCSPSSVSGLPMPAAPALLTQRCHCLLWAHSGMPHAASSSASACTQYMARTSMPVYDITISWPACSFAPICVFYFYIARLSGFFFYPRKAVICALRPFRSVESEMAAVRT